MTRIIFIYFVLNCAMLISARDGNQHKHPVCVIGAGISGVNLGILLQARGYDVHVFEKLPRVGGKIDTFTINDEVLVELGPLLYDSSDTKLIKYIDRFGMTSVKYNWTDKVAFDPSSGIILPYPSINAQQQAAIQRYMLKFLSVETFMAGLSPPGSVFTLKEGFFVLINKMASLVKNVRVNHELTGLKRNKDHQTLVFKINGSTRKQLCSKTILAFPPLLPNLEKIIPDLNSDEGSVLNQVKITKYASAAHHLPPLNHTVYGEAFRISANNSPIIGGPIGNGEMVALAKQSSWKLQNVYSSYHWIRGDYDIMPSEEELRQMSVSMDMTLQKMSTAPKKLHPIKATEYFPHAVPSSLKNRFYRKVDSIQGNKGLYFASTILTFEKINEALKMTESFVEKFFHSKRMTMSEL